MADVERQDDCLNPGEPSSRNGLTYAGWSGSRDKYSPELAPGQRWTWVKDESAYGLWPQRLKALDDRQWRDFSWLTAGALLDSVNDQIAKLIHDLVNGRRQRWIAAQRAAGKDKDDFVISRPDARRFIVLGDTGEADGSQYAVVDPMLAIDAQEGSDFMVILSDVIYPAGDINHYVNGFHEPYTDYKKPIYAIPGNHDWYDGLHGFMYHFCGADPLADVSYLPSSFSGSERISRWLWRRSSRPQRTKLLQHRAERFTDPDAKWEPVQPAPYFAIDMGSVRLVFIDTGIKGTLDREQGEWLCRVSRAPNQKKVLMTGKPIWVDGEYHPCGIEWEEKPGAVGPYGYETVDDIVRDPHNQYVAAIGGDVHNYQRSTVRIDDGPEEKRTIEYIVAGGSGAYMSATHRMDSPVHHDDRETAEERQLRLDRREPCKMPPETVEAPLDEKDFRCYPSRGDSIAYYWRFFGRRVLRTTLSMVAASLAVLIGLGLWWVLGSAGLDQSVGQIALVWICTVVAAVLAILLGMGIHRFAPRGLRTTALLLVVPAVIALVIVLVLADWEEWTRWIWKVSLVTVATIVVPVAATVAGYYLLGGESARLKRFLLLSIGIVVLAWLTVPSSLDDNTLLFLIVAAIATALLVAGLGFLDRWDWFRSKRYRAGINPWINIPLTLGVVLGVLGWFAYRLLHRWEELWVVPVTIVSLGLLLITLTIALLIATLPYGGGSALVAFRRRRRVDPEQTRRYVKEKIEGADPAGVPFEKHVEAICKFFLTKPTWGIKNKLSEIGNADVPPMFKSFLHVEIADGKLWISCYGVTGWKQHDGSEGHSVPREDCVSIPLGVPPIDSTNDAGDRGERALQSAGGDGVADS